MRALACVAAIIGGSCWIARLAFEGSAADVAFWVGAVLLGVATLVLGVQTAPRAPGWLQAIVGIGAVALAGSVLAIVRAEADAAVTDAVAGGLAVLLFGYLAVRWRPDPAPRVRGTHAR